MGLIRIEMIVVLFPDINHQVQQSHINLTPHKMDQVIGEMKIKIESKGHLENSLPT